MPVADDDPFTHVIPETARVAAIPPVIKDSGRILRRDKDVDLGDVAPKVLQGISNKVIERQLLWPVVQLDDDAHAVAAGQSGHVFQRRLVDGRLDFGQDGSVFELFEIAAGRGAIQQVG